VLDFGHKNPSEEMKMRRQSPHRANAACGKAVLLYSAIALLAGGGSESVAQRAAAADVAYVEEAKGRVVAQGSPVPLEALDVLSDQTHLQLDANSEMRLCHYRTRRVLNLGGPLRAVVSASGVSTEGDKRIDATSETCAAPLISTFQGGVVTRNAFATANVPLRPSIKVIDRSTNPVRKVALWDSTQQTLLVNFDRNTAKPVLDDGKSYLLVVERQDGGQLKMMLQARGGTSIGPLIVVVR
jgi:hypothetical protein